MADEEAGVKAFENFSGETGEVGISNNGGRGRVKWYVMV